MPLGLEWDVLFLRLLHLDCQRSLIDLLQDLRLKISCEVLPLDFVVAIRP